MIANKNISILETLTLSQIDDLIQEVELKEKGYKFYFTVDQFDLVKYCYPVGLEKVDEEYSLDYLSDQFVALSGLFTNEVKCMFLLKQYEDEFKDFRATIINMLFKGIEFVKDYEKFTDYLNSDLKKNIKNDFGLLISASTGVLQEGVQRFNFLANEKLITSYETFDKIAENYPDLEPLKKSFESSTKINEEIVSKLKSAFLSGKSEVEGRKQMAIENDCQAIDRICRINKNLINKNEKILLLFLSSTSASRNIYFRKDIIDYPKILNKKFNFHRTSAQIFLQLLLKGTEKSEELNELNKIKDFIQKRNQFENIILENNFDNLFKNRIIILRNRYANESLLLQNESFKSLFDKLNNSNYSVKRLNKIYTDLMIKFNKTGLEGIIESKNEILSIIDYEYKFKEYYTNWLKMVNENNIQNNKSENPYYFLIQRGLDPVFGTGHHLPLLFINNGENKGVINAITERYIIDEVKFIKANIDSSNKHIINFISKNVEKYLVNNDNLDTDFEDILIRCLFILIIPYDRSKTNNNEIRIAPEQTVLNILEKYLDDDNNMKVNLKSDYYYLLAWVARRNKEYEKSNEYCKKGKDINSTDPRFYHGQFLYNYCKFRELYPSNINCYEHNSFEILNFLNDALSEGKTAMSLYINWVDVEIEEKVLQKVKAALLAGLIIVLSNLYKFSNSEEYLKKGRVKLQELKSLEKEEYEEQPEYRYAESLLEYQEFLLLKNKNDSKANSKLEQSYTAILKAYNKIPSRIQYKGWYDFIKNKHQKLST
jgi:hypothetical protein